MWKPKGLWGFESLLPHKYRLTLISHTWGLQTKTPCMRVAAGEIYAEFYFEWIVRLDRFPAVLVGNERSKGSDTRVRNNSTKSSACIFEDSFVMEICKFWRVVRVVYGGGLENRWAFIASRGFESLTLRRMSKKDFTDLKEVSVRMEEYTFEEIKSALDVWHNHVMEQTRCEVIRLYNPHGEDIVYLRD